MSKNYENLYYKKAEEKSNFDIGHRKTILDFIEKSVTAGDSFVEVGCGA